MNTKDSPMDYKLSREQMESQITEMWDAVSGISGEDAHEAIEQAYLIEDKLRKAFDEQEKLRDSAPELLKENQSLKLELQKQKELNAELVKIKNLVEELIEVPHFRNQWISTTEAFESLIKKSSEI